MPFPVGVRRAESEGRGNCRRGWAKPGAARTAQEPWGGERTEQNPGHAPPEPGWGTPKHRQAGTGRPWEKRWPQGTPWVKVKPWKMGTPPNSGEDEIIPAAANQSCPLGRHGRVLLGQKLRGGRQLPRKEARPALGPRPSARGPTLARKRDEGRAGQPEARGVGAADVWGCRLLEKPVGSWSEEPAELRQGLRRSSPLRRTKSRISVPSIRDVLPTYTWVPPHTRSLTRDPALLVRGEHVWVQVPMLLATEAGGWASRLVKRGSHQRAGVCGRPSPPPLPHPRGQENQRRPRNVKAGTVRRTGSFLCCPGHGG